MTRKTIAFVGESSFDIYQSQMLSGIIKSFQGKDANLVYFIIEHLINVDRYPYPLELVADSLKRINIDGIIFLGWVWDIANDTPKFLSLLKDLGRIPILSIGRFVEGIPSLCMDGARHIVELLEHLYYEHGYRKIAFIKPITPDERYKAYEDFMKKHNIFDSALVLTNEDVDDVIDWTFTVRVEKEIRKLFDERKVKPDAIMSMYSPEAVNIAQALKERGYRIPEDIAITSWEDGETGRYANPPMTSVYYPFYEQGYEAGKAMLRMMEGEEIPSVINVPGELRIRRSCGCRSKILKLVDIQVSESSTGFIDKIDEKKVEKQFINSDVKINILDKRQMLYSFLRDIGVNSEENFLNMVEHYILNNELSVREIYAIQEDLLRFRAFITPFLQQDSVKLLRAESIYLRAQIIIQENLERTIGFKEVIKSGTAHIKREVTQKIVVALDNNRLFNSLEYSLRRLNVKNCHLFLFTGKENLTSRVKLVFSFINGKRVKSKNLSFSIKERDKFHSFLFGDKKHIFLFYVLHVQKELIGYILFELIGDAPTDERLYYELSVEVSSSLHRIFVLEKLKKANLSLKQARKEILKNVEIIKEKSSALEESNKKLSQLDKLKNDFIANITHDFRSIVTIILNSSDLALRFDDLKDIESTRKRYEAIYNASLKLKETVDRLLDLAKMDARGIKLIIRRLDIKAFLEGIVSFYQSAVFSTGIQVIGVLPPYEIKDFYTDVDKLEEILHNIISNALKFVNPEQGLIEISLVDKDNTVEIAVSDNGIGIPPEKLNIIFGRFEQIQNEKGGRFKGSGIGLSFVKELVGYLRGSIHAESEGIGRGAKFIMEFKKGRDVYKDMEIIEEEKPELIVQDRRKQLRNIVESTIKEAMQKDEIEVYFRDLNKEDEYDYKKGVILIVDDDHDIREILKDYLRKAGYKNFITAANGKDGIEAIYRYRPDLIISDYNMPKMRGDELYEKMTSNPDFKHIPLLFLTAVPDRNLMIEMKQKGVITYLHKPIDERELISSVAIHLKKYMELKSLFRKASTDELTGLANKPMIIKFLNDRIMLRAYRHLSLLFMDIDYFKDFNDKYGHVAGDLLLARIGSVIKNSIRSYDKAARYGGEEFLVVLPETSLPDARIVAEKIRANIKGSVIKFEEKALNVTISIGVSSLIDNEEYITKTLKIKNLRDIFEVKDIKQTNWEENEKMKEKIRDLLIDIADKALYRAKSTYCSGCFYHSINELEFKDNRCPVCGGINIIKGRDRVVTFSADIVK